MAALTCLLTENPIETATKGNLLGKTRLGHNRVQTGSRPGSGLVHTGSQLLQGSISHNALLSSYKSFIMADLKYHSFISCVGLI